LKAPVVVQGEDRKRDVLLQVPLHQLEGLTEHLVGLRHVPSLSPTGCIVRFAAPLSAESEWMRRASSQGVVHDGERERRERIHECAKIESSME